VEIWKKRNKNEEENMYFMEKPKSGSTLIFKTIADQKHLRIRLS
jgi:hypothetical protein